MCGSYVGDAEPGVWLKCGSCGEESALHESTKGESEMELEKIKGTVRKFLGTRGFGFIESQDGRQFFVHQSEVDMDGWRFLEPGWKVEFLPIVTERGPKAVKVKIISRSETK